ncbi:MAG: hypothetical protein JOZ43_08800 [Acidobacteriales bacterium]|nr:hypothetical protein [Terriglobales bacterium]
MLLKSHTLTLFAGFATAALACAQAVAQAPDVATIVQKMTLAQRANQELSYELLREYQVFAASDAQPRTEVLARIDFAPPGQKTYTIERSTGGMGERAVRHALDHEMDLTKDPERIELTERNYNFSYVSEDTLAGHQCFVLAARPKRNDRDLLIASIWVDAQNYRIRRIQGHPQKSPSFWIKSLELTLNYDERHGMWMQTSTHAQADVRFSGPFTLLSQDLSVHLTPAVASSRNRSRNVRTAMLAGAALHGVK